MNCTSLSVVRGVRPRGATPSNGGICASPPPPLLEPLPVPPVTCPLTLQVGNEMLDEGGSEELLVLLLLAAGVEVLFLLPTEVVEVG